MMNMKIKCINFLWIIIFYPESAPFEGLDKYPPQRGGNKRFTIRLTLYNLSSPYSFYLKPLEMMNMKIKTINFLIFISIIL